VQLLTGMRQSVRAGDGGVTVNVDVAHTAVYDAVPLSAFLLKSMGLRDPRALERLRKTQYMQAKALLIHKEVNAPSTQNDEHQNLIGFIQSVSVPVVWGKLSGYMECMFLCF